MRVIKKLILKAYYNMSFKKQRIKMELLNVNPHTLTNMPAKVRG